MPGEVRGDDLEVIRIKEAHLTRRSVARSQAFTRSVQATAAAMGTIYSTKNIADRVLNLVILGLLVVVVIAAVIKIWVDGNEKRRLRERLTALETKTREYEDELARREGQLLELQRRLPNRGGQ